MTSKILEGVSGKLSEQWAASLLTPAFAFWAGGALAITQDPNRRKIFLPQYQQLPNSLQIAVLVLCLAILTASAFILQRFDTEIIRLLEGYWYPPFRFLLIPLKKRHIRRKQTLETRWQTLHNANPLSAIPLSADFAACDRLLHQYPNRSADIMPFSVGNILRAAERRPRDRYGLDPIICWPRLWLLLPDAAKKDITEAYSDLTTTTRLWLWSILFLIWSLWAWWAIPLGLLSASFAYSRIQDNASAYADLIESAFDLHRPLLYQSLRFPLPSNPAEESALGQQLTEYLWRGSDRPHPAFLPLPAKP